MLPPANPLRQLLENADTSDQIFMHLSIGDLFHLSNSTPAICDAIFDHLARRRCFTPLTSIVQPTPLINEYILRFGEYRCLEPCAVKGVTECILATEQWRFYTASYDAQSQRQMVLIFRSIDGFYKYDIINFT